MSVVVGYTPSSQGDAALRAAVRQARRSGEPLVVASHLYYDPEHGSSVADESVVAEALSALDVEGIETSVRTGDAGDAGEFLLQVAEDCSASMVVIGLRRKSPIGKLSLGAAARRLVISAPCPVLTVKEDVAP